MRPKEASRSAIAVSLMRASHSVNDAAPLIQDACAFKLFSGDEIELVRRDLLGRLEDGGCHPGDERLPDVSLAAVLRAYPGYGYVILRMSYCEEDRKSVVSGKSASVIVDFGCCRIFINKKNFIYLFYFF